MVYGLLGLTYCHLNAILVCKGGYQLIIILWTRKGHESLSIRIWSLKLSQLVTAPILYIALILPSENY